ncbi:uncharacterized protein LOC135469351 [Liolophura sinensis]|uniref:uncharacterized protein LOC135469351 n=1 Tax=Liolophura sinensis TaxID=3198878 RepID=UPI00315910D7
MAERMDLARLLAQLDRPSDEEHGDTDTSSMQDSDSAEYVTVDPVITFDGDPSSATTESLGEGCSSKNTTDEDIARPDPMEASTIADDSQKDPDVADSCVDDDSSTDESASLGEHLKKGRSRKRARDPSQWKANVRKRL